MTPSMPPIPAEVDAVFATFPAPVRGRLISLRAVIFAAAEATGTAPLQEVLKWGQPAYLPDRKQGTTLRLGWSDRRPELCALLVHCQTDLVGRWQVLFGDAFQFEGRRAVLVPVADPQGEAALQQMAAMALTYHRDKAERA